MPIREWHESIRITIECSDRELPRAIAALNGNVQPEVHLHLTGEQAQHLAQERSLQLSSQLTHRSLNRG